MLMKNKPGGKANNAWCRSNNATERIEIDHHSAAGNDVTTQLIDTVNTFRSYQATLPVKGSWIKYNDVNFDCLTEGYLIVNAKASRQHNTIYPREDSKRQDYR